jgi:phosphoribosylformylglycinamidine synthase
VTEPLHRQLGLRDDEHDRIVATLGREPNRAELAMYSVMWSEHCSYKSSKIHLRTLPTEGEAVLVGPGQDAGAVDAGDGDAIVFKMESHSHPSAIEPYQGAATGVGGIVRDIVSMGARPVALLDPLMFGPLTDPRNRWLFEGVVAGIGGYGNCIGVPTVGGEIRFAEAHASNPCVNVMCIGFAKADELATSQSLVPHVGSLMVLYGAATGRDGIGGVSVLASATLEAGAEASRPSVQIGDPFAEKLLIEASLQLIGEDLLEGLQDLGGAGITCAVSESAARAGMGADVDLDAVPLRAVDMEPFEILTSESQERMLAIVHPSKLAAVEAVCTRWGSRTAVIATLVDGGELTIRHRGEVVARMPAGSLVDEGPEYDRPRAEPAHVDALDPALTPFDGDLSQALRTVLASPSIASKRWVWRQYDRVVQGNTVAGPDSDGAVIRIPGTLKGAVVSSDGKGRFGRLDPYLGAMHAVAESARNVAVTGARPVAITNCLNFGNPERPEIMAQLVEAIEGMSDACRFFDTPITGGNVSLYNETLGGGIYPTPVIGIVGLMKTAAPVTIPFKNAGRSVILLGGAGACDDVRFGSTQYAKEIEQQLWGLPPALDLDREKRVQEAIREIVAAGLAESAHDLSDGGLAVALAECCFGPGEIGAQIDLDSDLRPEVLAFHEGPSRILISTAHAKQVADIAERHGVEAPVVGATIETGMEIRQRGNTLGSWDIAALRAAYEGALEAHVG